MADDAAHHTGASAELDKARAGDPRALARLISLVEDESPRVRSVIKDLMPGTGGARIIGLTGAPGVGKSTITGALVGAFRADGARVAVLAVDPSSPFTPTVVTIGGFQSPSFRSASAIMLRRSRTT